MDTRLQLIRFCLAFFKRDCLQTVLVIFYKTRVPEIFLKPGTRGRGRKYCIANKEDTIRNALSVRSTPVCITAHVVQILEGKRY